MRFLFGVLLLAFGIGIGPLMAQNQKASDKASEAGMIIPAGTIMPYAGSTAPAGWVFAAGQEYNTTGTYAKLYAAIGTTYCTNDHGAGGTCTTGVFRVPDMRGRFVGGKDNMNGIAANRITAAKTLDASILGKAGGNQNYTPAGSVPSSGLGFSGSSTSYSVSVPSHYHGVGGGMGGGGHEHNYNTAASGSASGNPGSTWTDMLRALSAFQTTGGGGHSHSGYVGNGGGSNGDSSFTATGTNTPSGSITGSASLTGTEGNNLSPTIILNYIIKI